MDNFIKPPAIVPAGEIKVLLDWLGYRRRVLDRFPVHIQDKERSIGCICEIDGTKPVIHRSQELRICVSPPCPVSYPVGFDDLTVNEVPPHVANERVSVILERIR